MLTLKRFFSTYFPKTSCFRDLVLLMFGISFLFGIMLGSFPLEVPDGARYAEIPREMLVSGDYLTPHLNGVKYFEKPPLLYWMQAVSIKAFGINEWSVHFVNALMALITCLFIYAIGRKLYDRYTGIFASLILATSNLFFILARIITLDMTLTAFLSMGLLCFLIGAQADRYKSSFTYANKVFPVGKIYLLFFYLFIALAVMTKGLVGLLLPGGIILFWTIWFHDWHRLKNYHILTGSLLFLLIAAPWHILVQLKNPEFFNFYFIEQHFLRYFTTYAGRMQPAWFFSAIFIAGFFPWICFLPAALRLCLPNKGDIRKYRDKYRNEVFFLIWAGVVFLFYNFSDSKLPPYILPMIPPLAIIVGRYLAEVYIGKKQPEVSFAPAQLQNTNQNSFFQYRFFQVLRSKIQLQRFYRKLFKHEKNNNKQHVNIKTLKSSLKIICSINFILGLSILITIRFLDFSKYAFTPLAFYLIANTLIIGSLLTYFFYKKYGVKTGLIWMFMAQVLFLLSLAPNVSTINGKSIKPLIEILRPHLPINHEYEVASFYDYYQDLPYYLNHVVTVVEYQGELSFGVQHAGMNHQMISADVFWQKWHSNKKMFVIIGQRYYTDFKARAKNKIYFLGQYLDTMLITN